MTKRLLAVVVAALAAAVPASAKEGVTAQVVPIPADAEGRVHVTWTLGYVEEGARRPFSALGVFVVLRDSQGRETTAVGNEHDYGEGLYSAEVAVPPGGIDDVRIGLHGTTDVFFPLDGDAVVAATGGDRDLAPWLAAAASLLLVLFAALIVYRRRAPIARMRATKGLSGSSHAGS